MTDPKVGDHVKGVSKKFPENVYSGVIKEIHIREHSEQDYFILKIDKDHIGNVHKILPEGTATFCYPDDKYQITITPKHIVEWRKRLDS
jgi:hypothetical protein